MSSPFIKARGWERFVVYDATGAFSLSPSAKNMPPCDARGRAVTAPGRSRGSLSDEESPEKKGSKARGDGASERDRVTIEYCTVERPTMTLRGSAEEYERHALALQAYLQEKFPKLRVTLQRPPATLARAKDKGISHAHDAIYVPASWSEPRMPSPAEGRRRFPRVNAFEVKLNGRLIFSKLAGGPAADFPKMHDDEPKITGLIGVDKGKAVLPVGFAAKLPTELGDGSGEVLSWRTSKPLPEGLSVDAHGIIRGVPFLPTKAQKVALIASNSRGEASYKMSIQVRGDAPPPFSYEKTKMMLTRGAAAPKNRPRSIGKATTDARFSIKPALPDGLAIDEDNGVIVGTPLKAQRRVRYTVRARNKYGTTTTELSVTVLDVLTIDEYTDVCPRYVAGRPIPPNLPQGAKHSFERVWFHIQPPLPRGLSMPVATGILRGCREGVYTPLGILGGTPVAPQRPTQYKVTAESRFSTVTSTLTIEVMPKARAEEAKANEELDVIEMIMAAPAEGKRHISYTGPVQKGKEWLALGRLSAPMVTPPLEMGVEGAEELIGFLAELGAAE